MNSFLWQQYRKLGSEFFLRKAAGGKWLFFEEHTLPRHGRGLLRSGRTEFWMHMAETMIIARASAREVTQNG
jgi:hypothetical protein